MATLSTNVKKGQAVDDIANGPNILREGDSNKANDNTATSQETSIKDLDSEPDKNEKLIRELKESMNIKDIDVTILPDKLVTSDRDDSKTDEDDRDVTEDSSTDDHEEEKETAEVREETTPSKDKTNESSDDSDKTLIMDGIDDTQLDKIGDILNMERQKTKKQQSTETEDEYVTTTKPRRKKATKTTAPGKYNNHFVKKTIAHVNKFTHSALRKHKSSTHRKLYVKRITKNRITVSGKYTTKHKRLHANKLIKKSTNVRELEPTTHIIDEEAETSSGTTSVQVNIKR
ncbi:unnamed protein product [Spodoptera littoralis]|uniref:Uncharacterized protein n=1 Tax=Spodoptera littoralis TaxID=7109 RepID=A0A9P0I9E1_SPOLI|nr:unnamed protein product [Spodoptera littoralis]CAH1642638.1 unnamed protein product [Spodoptera littoralis]